MRKPWAPFIAGIGLALVIFATACDQPAASVPTEVPSPIAAPATATATPIPPTTTPTRAPATPTTAAPTATRPAAANTTGNVSISDLTARAKANTEYSFTMEATILGQVITASIFVKGPMVRQEIDFGGEKGIMIIDQSKKVAYTMEGDQSVAVRQDISGSTDQANPNDALQNLPPDTRIVGTETIDGKSAVVLEVADQQEQMKVWVWAEKGLILRAEATAVPGLVSMEFRDYKFGSLPDSLFQVPAGTQVVEASPTGP